MPAQTGRRLPVADALGRGALAQRSRERKDGVVPAILMYHRVCDAHPAHPDPHRLSVSPAEFRAHIQYLAGHHTVLSLADLAFAHLAGALPDDAAAVTLDDGTIDGLRYAAPILVAEGIPATYFVMTDRLHEKHEPWWQVLARVFLTDRPLPDSILLTAFEGRDDLELPTNTQAERLAAYARIHRVLMYAALELRLTAMSYIEHWSGHDMLARESDRVLLEHEIRELSAMPGQSIGAHTVYHLRLPLQPPSRQDQEIGESKRELESVLDTEVTLFSYPFGARDDYTIGAVERAGFVAAVSTEASAVSRRASVFDLPRLDVKAEGVDGLRRLISEAAVRQREQS